MANEIIYDVLINYLNSAIIKLEIKKIKSSPYSTLKRAVFISLYNMIKYKGNVEMCL